MGYNQKKISKLVQKQKSFFNSNKTLGVNWRKSQLLKLKFVLEDSSQVLIDAMAKDSGRSEQEIYLCDIAPLVAELNEAIKHIHCWTKPRHKFAGFACFPATSYKVNRMPYGVTLIISPYNFPVNLSLGPLIAAIAGGNTAVIKASSKTPKTTAVLQQLISDNFPKSYVAVVDGDHDIANMLLKEKFDKIFYTGSTKVARHVLRQAANNLTPTALELGSVNGNWAIVRKDANIDDAARKIAFMKLCNAGQVCINVNQVAVAVEVAEEFNEKLGKEFMRMIGEDATENKEYPKLINTEAFERCFALCKKYSQRVVYGGHYDMDKNKFGPTILYPISANDEITKMELFNPLLPVVPYKDMQVDKIVDIISERAHPLALYVFTKDKKWADSIMDSLQFGGGCINEVCSQFIAKGAPFNGVGQSGMGSYHGVWGFNEFTHPATVLKGRTWFNLNLREHPYKGAQNSFKVALAKLFMR